MPFYPSLKIRKSDSALSKLKKVRVANRLTLLKKKMIQHFLDSGTKPRNNKSIKIATWNLREFGGSKYFGRDYEALYYIGEIISHFDLVALQEIRGNLKEFNSLRKILGPDWSFIGTDVTDGYAGNGERMIFVYNRKKVNFKHIAGEISLGEGEKIKASFGERLKLEQDLKVQLPPNTDLSGIYKARLKSARGKKKLDADLEIPLPKDSTLSLPEGCSLVVKKNTVVTSPARGKAKVTLDNSIEGKEFGLRFNPDSFDDSLRQFARSPFLISFQSGWLKLNLCTVHIYYGSADDKKKLEQRRSEIEKISASLAKKAKTEFKDDKEAFLGVLGDFNIIGKGHPTMEALESNGFLIPEELKSIPGSNVAKDKAYDQIAFWNPKRITEYAKLDVLGANVFDFFQYIFTKDDESIYRAEKNNGLKATSRYSTWRTYKMSDHLPMWIELRTDFSKEYLDKITQ